MKDKVVIVTGGAGGIGIAVSKAFAAQGTSDAVANIDPTGPNRSPTASWRAAVKPWRYRWTSPRKKRSTRPSSVPWSISAG